MKKYAKIILLSFFIIMFSNTAFAGIKRQIIAEKVEEIKIDKQWAIFIGVSKYKEWQNLKNPVKDVKETAEIIRKKYYFDETIELYDENASAENILKALSKIKNEANVNDSVFIYYAGHGGFSEVTSTGYWIPNDAGLDKIKRQNWISVPEIKSFFMNLKARHLFLVVDACYGHEFAENSRGKPNDIDNEYLRRGYQKISRQVIVSGKEDSISDNLDFAEQLKVALNGNTKQFLDPVSLYETMKLGVKKSTPIIGNIDGTGYQKDSSYVLFLRTKEDQEIIAKKIEEENRIKKEEEEKQQAIQKKKLEQEAFDAKPYNYITASLGTILLKSLTSQELLGDNIILNVGYKGKLDKIKYNVDLIAGYLAYRAEEKKEQIDEDGKIVTDGAFVVPKAARDDILYGLGADIAYEFYSMEKLISAYGGVGAKAAFTSVDNLSDLYLKVGVDITPQNYLVGLEYKHGLTPFGGIGQIQLNIGWGWK